MKSILKTIKGVAIISFTLIFAISASCTPKTGKKEVAQKPPNIIVIFADDLGYGDIGCYGAKGIKTPELDALAAGGFRSTDFFVPANVCSPSRAALLTGRYPMRVGYPLATRPSFEKLAIPELLKLVGYHSLIVGEASPWYECRRIASSGCWI